MDTAQNKPVPPFSDYLSDRSGKVGRVALCLLSEAVLFVFWLALAWVIAKVRNYFESKGVQDWCATAFQVVSSVSTLVLAGIYIVHDIKVAFVDCFQRSKPDRTSVE